MDGKYFRNRMVNKNTYPVVRHLEEEMAWFTNVVNKRFSNYFDQKGEKNSTIEIPPPILNGEPSVYSEFILHYNLSIEERIILILSITPHIQPHLLDVFFTANKQLGRGFTEFGGVKGDQYSGFLPTGETAMFILAGNDLKRRIQLSSIFDQEHFFYKHNILKLNSSNDNEPFLSGIIQISEEYIDYFSKGKPHKPKFSLTFPAKLIATKLEWDDLILESQILTQVEEIITWIKHGSTLLNEWDLGRRIMPGFRSLFYGPAGTGKTLTAGLIGKKAGREVYRVDLSMVISKYIGETEKNLGKIFDKAENKRWILFFDEADALFGKRTDIGDAHDRYANQEVSYLLQKVEDYNGVVILATNYKSNLDEAFLRRFQSTIYFPIPKPEQRKSIWENAISQKATLEEGINFSYLANKYELSGGSIMNIIRYASLNAIKAGDNVIRQKDLLDGIIREFRKEGKMF